LILNTTSTFFPPQKQGKSDEFYVSNFLEGSGCYYVMGFKFDYDTLTLPPYIMKIRLDGSMESIRYFSDSLKFQSLRLSYDKSKIVIFGAENNNNVEISQVLYELDTNLQILDKLTLNTSLFVDKTLFGFYPCSNGDYIITGAVGYTNNFTPTTPKQGWVTTARINPYGNVGERRAETKRNCNGNTEPK